MNNKTVILTGVNSLLGKAILEKLIHRGYYVIGTVSNKEKYVESFNHKNCSIYELDLSTSISIRNFANEVKNKFNNIETIISNAGYVLAGPLENLKEKQIRKQMDVNFMGNVLLTKEFISYFKNNKSGNFVFISSLCGLVAFPMFSMYHASKWALEGFVESLSHELSLFNINVKLIEPGGIKYKENTAKVEIAENINEEYKDLMKQVFETDWFPSFALPEEIADIVLTATEDKSDKLRYLAGESCELLVKERYTNFENENYLKAIGKRLNSSNEY